MKTLFFLFFIIMSLLLACNQNYIPKPPGYFRIELPKREYQTYNHKCPYTFDYPTYYKAIKSEQANAEPCWLNLDFPKFKAKIHLSYKNVSGNVNELLEECRTLAYKHDIKADAINEILYSDSINKVYGILYEIKGNVASNIQFYVTDSIKHFLRGALYFEVIPNKDSLAPVIDFIEQDISHLVETLRWK